MPIRWLGREPQIGMWVDDEIKGGIADAQPAIDALGKALREIELSILEPTTRQIITFNAQSLVAESQPPMAVNALGWDLTIEQLDELIAYLEAVRRVKADEE